MYKNREQTIVKTQLSSDVFLFNFYHILITIIWIVATNKKFMWTKNCFPNHKIFPEDKNMIFRRCKMPILVSNWNQPIYRFLMNIIKVTNCVETRCKFQYYSKTKQTTTPRNIIIQELFDKQTLFHMII